MEYQQGKQENPEYQQQGESKYILGMNRNNNKDSNGIKPETIDDKIEVFDVSPDKTIPKKLKKLDRSESCM